MLNELGIPGERRLAGISRYARREWEAIRDNIDVGRDPDDLVPVTRILLIAEESCFN